MRVCVCVCVHVCACMSGCVCVRGWGGVDVMCIQHVLACLTAGKAVPDVIRLFTDHSPCSVE